MEEAPSPSRFPASQAETNRSWTPFQRLADEQVYRLLVVLRREVRRHGGSLRELEQALGWRRGYLSQLLRGTIYLKAHHFFSLAELLDFDAGRLLTTLCADDEEEDEGSELVANDSSSENRSVPNLRTLVAELVQAHLSEAANSASFGARDGVVHTDFSQPAGQRAGPPKQRAQWLLAHLRQTIFDREVTLRELAKILGWGKGTVYATLSETAQLTMRCLFEVLAGLDEDPGRFFHRFFGPLAGEGRPGEELAGSVPDGVVGEGADSESAPLDEVSLLRFALRSLLAPLIAELVEEYLAGRSKNK